MRNTTRLFWSAALVWAVLGPVGALPVRAEPATAIKWADLVPPAPPKPPKAFFAGRNSANSPDHGTATGQADGRWMSNRVPDETATAPAVVEALNGKTVRIGGYIVPLDFDATRVKEFLLVPFVGACIHVPPPPANQLIYVKAPQGFDVKGTFDPVFVTGKLTTTFAPTGIADAGYTLDAEVVEGKGE